jgi:HSP20 family protein
MVDQTHRERGWAEHTKSTPPLVPAADIFACDDNLVLILDMPGVASTAVEIKLDQHLLTVIGTIGDCVPPGHSLTHAEFADGAYERSFTLPEDIDDTRIEASMKNGQLRLLLPKAEPTPMRTIQVKTN